MASPKGKFTMQDAGKAAGLSGAVAGVAAVSAWIVLIISRLAPDLIINESDKVIWVAGVAAVLSAVYQVIVRWQTDTRPDGEKKNATG